MASFQNTVNQHAARAQVREMQILNPRPVNQHAARAQAREIWMKYPELHNYE